MPASLAWFIAGFFAGALLTVIAGGYAMWRAIRILTLTVALAQAPKQIESVPVGPGVN